MFSKRRKVKPLYIVTLCAVMLFFVNRYFFSLTPVINSSVSHFIYPVLLAQRFLVRTTTTFFSRKKQVAQLEKSFNQLAINNQDLIAEIIKLRASIVYQEGIGELSEFQRRYDADYKLTAQIVLRQISPQSNFVLINKGSRHGIQKDMIGVYKNILLGRVTDVYPLYSKLLLVTDSACKVSAYCANTGSSGIHEGTNTLNESVLRRVSHLSRIQEGDMIISSGEGIVFPQGFGLGQIKSVEPDGLYFNVSVQPLIDLQKINYCMIIKKGEATAKLDA